MKQTIAVLILLASAFALNAIPTRRTTIKLEQPDGTTIEAKFCGDEYHHYYITPEGYLITKNAEGFYVYDEQEGEYETTEKYRKTIQKARTARRVRTIRKAPHQAERGMVILVNFKDKKFSHGRENFENLLNQKGYDYNGATGSASDYFHDVSSGKYAPKFDLYGPYTLDMDMSYYGKNDTGGSDSKPDQMVVDAVEKLAADKTANVNFANYDSDNDGNIDNIFIYYAGYGENERGVSSDAIWPHAWEVYPENIKGQLEYDGKIIKGYACTSELSGGTGTTLCGIGTFCHEFGHVLGLPDFYETTYSSGHKTIGDWDIMDSGGYLNEGNTPPSYSAHERFYLGWLTPEIISTPGEYTLEHIEKSNKAYMITENGKHNLDPANPNPNTYFLLENRQNSGWDTYLPGHGLMITKTVYNASEWEANTPNNNPNSQGYDLIEADGRAPRRNSGKPGDLFPGTSHVTHYEPYSHFPITNIKETDGVITFTFMEKNSTPDGYIVGEPFVETFDKLKGNNSEITDIDKMADNLGWTGYKLFTNNKEIKIGSNSKKGYLETPALNFSGDVLVKFEAQSKDITAINLEVGGTKVYSSAVGAKSEYSAVISNFTPNQKIKFSVDKGIFYLDNIMIGQYMTNSTPIEKTELESEVILIHNATDNRIIKNLPKQSTVNCFDLSGRQLWQRPAKGETMEFTRPQGFYIIQIRYENKTITLKGL